jgi:hypothetical protein
MGQAVEVGGIPEFPEDKQSSVTQSTSFQNRGLKAGQRARFFEESFASSRTAPGNNENPPRGNEEREGFCLSSCSSFLRGGFSEESIV